MIKKIFIVAGLAAVVAAALIFSLLQSGGVPQLSDFEKQQQIRSVLEQQLNGSATIVLGGSKVCPDVCTNWAQVSCRDGKRYSEQYCINYPDDAKTKEECDAGKEPFTNTKTELVKSCG